MPIMSNILNHTILAGLIFANLNEIKMRSVVQFSAVLRMFLLIVITGFIGIGTVLAQDGANSGAATQNDSEQTVSTSIGKDSQLPIPRFVSLKFDRINVRVGPDQHKYKIAWVYQKSGLPVEVIAEYDQWRRIRDSNGDQGWVLGTQLDGRRTVMTAPWIKGDQLFTMRKTPEDNGTLVAEVQSGVIGSVRSCNGMWCELEIKGYRGWLRQMDLWGVYPGEKIKK